MALAPSLTWLFIGRVISGITSASVSTAFAYIADVTPPETARGGVRQNRRGIRRRIHSWPGGRRAARRHGSAVAVLGRGGPELYQYALWLADPAGVSAARSPHFIPMEKRKSARARCICCAPTGFSPGLSVVNFFAQVAHVVLPSTFVLYADLSIWLGCNNRRPDAGAWSASARWSCKARRSGRSSGVSASGGRCCWGSAAVRSAF